jgi:hypothetical protein
LKRAHGRSHRYVFISRCAVNTPAVGKLSAAYVTDLVLLLKSNILCCVVQKAEQPSDTAAAAAGLLAPSISSNSSGSTSFVADAVRTARAAFERLYFLLSRRQRQSHIGESDAPDAVELKPLMADDVSAVFTAPVFQLCVLLLLFSTVRRSAITVSLRSIEQLHVYASIHASAQVKLVLCS